MADASFEMVTSNTWTMLVGTLRRCNSGIAVFVWEGQELGMELASLPALKLDFSSRIAIVGR